MSAQLTRYRLAQAGHFEQDLLPHAQALRTPLVQTEAFRALSTALLVAARPDLLRADPTGGETVTSVAARWGSAHSGRLTAACRDRLAESSRTTPHT